MTNHQGLNIKTVQAQFKILSLQNFYDHAKLFQKTNLAHDLDLLTSNRQCFQSVLMFHGFHTQSASLTDKEAGGTREVFFLFSSLLSPAKGLQKLIHYINGDIHICTVHCPFYK